MVRRAQRSLRQALVGAVLVALGAIAGGCSTPTLPLPPPAALTASAPDADGWVTVEGDVLDGAFVFCLNELTERGVIVRAGEDGHFVLQVQAESGHYLTVWQKSGSDYGEQRSIPVP